MIATGDSGYRGGAPIKESTTPETEHSNNIVLFPKTLDYYQIQLTVMLENERYGEAMDLLRFLLQCQGQEERHYDEWRALLEWLEAAFPHYGEDLPEVREEREEEEISEEDMARQHARSKLEQDDGYADKLLRTVMEEPLSEQTMLALEQLAYLDRPEIDDSLIGWLKDKTLHPLLQFRVLQTLRRRGVQGIIAFTRGEEPVEVEIDTVPLRPEDFPIQIVQILERVADQTEVHEPTLFYFAQELWIQYVMAVYGTRDYMSMLEENDSMTDIWGAALHMTVADSLGGSHDEEDTRSMYAVTGAMRFRLEQAYRSMKQFVSAGLDGQ
ncbi:hypothetical protein SAMN04487896_5218 [Paenibacillus sp. ov031]|uniref:hypothetical protein n=2 Tax=Paenibacillus TaxID=44249 RepID=UPI00088A08CC|nr:hypothetical protein SAMN05428961_10847 [Paenibacillus sp. OK060]SHN83153.1 hypothetical protein SAMN04487896_5218 [Paenibacillus sp. ov031]SLK14621.1 hypothetical protein SAMN06272722_10948 [Paenibacillus sp. RU5A]SOC73565.1 hypothetical protein SAMN05880581_10948 [Paenibacillus sp. RU26A]SOC75740.1 hypothetical protein SAMN05880586_10948 [Paenibacillus sp. RU5M]